MDKEKAHPVIIKRIKKVAHKHHGGAWKIAYADFVTAMMSFFLLMWLLSMMNKYQLQGISEYFKKPLKEIFTKQDNVAKTTTVKPDTEGPTTFANTGLKDREKDSPDKGAGNLDKAKNEADKSQGEPQKPADVKLSKEQEAKAIEEAKMLQAQNDKMQAMKSDLEEKLKKDPNASQFKNQLDFVVTSDGLKIVIKDLKDKPMFSQGKTDFQKYAEQIITWLSAQVNRYPNRLMIIGHTDNIPYPSNAKYGNWELSADRANATRRTLINHGVSEEKILRVVGGADTDSLNTFTPNHPANRRIDIIILNSQAEKRIQEQ